MLNDVIERITDSSVYDLVIYYTLTMGIKVIISFILHVIRFEFSLQKLKKQAEVKNDEKSKQQFKEAKAKYNQKFYVKSKINNIIFFLLLGQVFNFVFMKKLLFVLMKYVGLAAVPVFKSPVEQIPSKIFNMMMNMAINKLQSKPIEFLFDKALPPYQKPVSIQMLVKEMMEEKMIAQDMKLMEQQIEQTMAEKKNE